MPYLSQFQEAEGVAVQIAERTGNLAVAIYSAQRLAEDITKAHYGYHFPLHCGSKGQLLLAFEDPAFIEAYLARDLERLTNETITDPELLRAELAKIRRAGMAMTVADVQPFTGSMAAPIRDGTGRVIASLCFIYRKALARNDKRREELQDQLMHMAHSISIDLGWRPDRG
jgi:DNA-binding IclR family transcriptional regulator